MQNLRTYFNIYDNEKSEFIVFTFHQNFNFKFILTLERIIPKEFEKSIKL